MAAIKYKIKLTGSEQVNEVSHRGKAPVLTGSGRSRCSRHMASGNGSRN